MITKQSHDLNDKNTTFDVSSINWSNHSTSSSQIKLQINDYDTYQSYPTKLDQLYTKVSQVPIIRIYGSINVEHKSPGFELSPNKRRKLNNEISSNNNKSSVFNVVIHVHNFYPYFYVDCHETDYNKLQSQEFFDSLITYLENLLKQSFGKRRGRKGTEEQELETDEEEEEANEEAKNDQNRKPDDHQKSKTLRKYIANVSICKGVSIYGFQLGYKLFYKISLLSPLYKNRLARMFQENKVSLYRFDQNDNDEKKKKPPYSYVYEVHIPLLLQFLTDFNLFGCGWLFVDTDHINKGPNTRGLYFRTPLFTDISREAYNQSQIYSLTKFLQRYITADNVLVDGGNLQSFTRIGKTMLEMDITTSAIVNRSWLSARELHDDFTERNEFNEYQRDLKIFGYPKHGYKHELDGNPKIYISSLKHIYNDLKYQCHLKNSNFDVSVDVLESNTRNYFGTGSTKWSNQKQLDELLDYLIQMNGSSKNMGFDIYSEKIIKDRHSQDDYDFDILEDFKTSFDTVDIEKNLQFHNEKMKFVDNLVIWGDYNDLFKLSQSITSLSSPELNAIPEKSIEIYDNDSDTDTEKGEINLFSENGVDINEIEDQEDTGNINFEEDEDKKENGNENQNVFNIDEDDEIEDYDSAEEFDETLMRSMTQLKTQNNVEKAVKKPSFDILSQIEDVSFTPTPIQNISPPLINMKPGKNEYEVIVPDQLKKENYSKSFQNFGILEINYTDPYYSKKDDIPLRPFIFANQKMHVQLKNEETMPKLDIIDPNNLKKLDPVNSTRTWQYQIDPPSKASISNWLKNEESKVIKKKLKYRSQIEPGITQSNDYKFSYNSEKVARKPDEFNYLSDFHLEIHVSPPNSKLAADPLRDPISFIFYSFDDANEMFNDSKLKSGILVFGKFDLKLLGSLSKSLSQHIEYFEHEKSMIERLIELVQFFDPDILSGYEVNSMSWGYIVERFRDVFEMNIMSDLSRGSHRSNGKFGDRWGYTHTANIEISGRHILNVWRIVKSDLSLTSYTLENVCYHLLHKSLPRYSLHQISNWLNSGNFQDLYVALSYYIKRIELTLKIIVVQELITRNVEHSRLIGIEFNSNYYRGSQYKVESLLCRISKPESILLNSPSKIQVHELRPIECLPLVMEPKANFYKSPLIVLDFQSLYPSIMIAYNYCYSTLIGKLHNYKPKKNNIGYLKNLDLPPGIVELLKNDDAINISPNGFAFVKSHIRKSILAKMLEEILNIRIKTKSVMKLFRDDTELTKLYNSRQVALKLIANVTYGYTSATFSGRMPNSDIADAIVASGREILETSIELIESGGFGAKVVYGDTDSLFVYFPGKSKAEAFSSGRKIAKLVTDYFPDPLQLKFEKVYHPCVLLAKKRYVGYSYEYENQKVPKFDAKGIETVRRDGVPAQQKMTEKALRILFETKDLSKVKDYTLKQFYKIFFNKISINDFCFAKAVKYGDYKDERYLPPGALLSSKAAEEDPRKEPQYKERVPYLVIRDSTKIRIKDRVMFPEDFIKTLSTSEPLMLDYEYYITRMLIPPLERIFNLLGADVKGWYKEMPKFTRTNVVSIYNDSCLVCGNRLDGGQYVCSNCSFDKEQLATNVMMSYKKIDEKTKEIENLCRKCVQNVFLPGGSMSQYTNNCVNRDCSVYFNKVKAQQESRQLLDRKVKVLEEIDW
ncbi:REV3 [Candida pseudojiufengensis]|uniref:REV3 n=1 Tax=Candida pseudojiufengensis TaxID=497109 RepID=UPI0022259AC5|nr:REV3 [Candida pseudojiufengensis]KAI5961013.1 REV3 [Candida pseudojiufengensis]